jgi:APA family basic amino acid/polyamine antiporter
MTIAIFLVLDFVYLKTRTSGIGVLLLLTGFPVYLIWQRVGLPADSSVRSQSEPKT